MGMSKKKPIALILGAAAALIAVLCYAQFHWHRHGSGKRSADQNPVVAVVNNTILHRSDLSVLSPPETQDRALGLMVDFTLLDQAAQLKHIVVTDGEMAQMRQAVVANQDANSYSAAAAKLGRTAAGLDLQLKHAVMLEKLSDRNLPPDPKEMYHVRGILIEPHGKRAQSDSAALRYAESLQKQIAAGADIAALARADSDDRLSGANGGDLGIIQTVGAPNLVRQSLDFSLQLTLAEAVGTARPGSFLGGPIHGALGYWVVRVVSTDKKPLGDAPLYQHVTSEWRSRWRSRIEPGVMARLRSAAYIEPPLAEPMPQRKSARL